MKSEEFTIEQKEYLQGFLAGAQMQRATASAGPARVDPAPAAKAETALGPDALQRIAQDSFLAQGKTLSQEEQAKRDRHGLDLWEQVIAHARDRLFPKGTDVFLFKFQGLFYVAPAQNAFMCRLRFPAGIISSSQMRGLADLTETLAGGHADVTTRSNLQIREISAGNTADLIMGLCDLGIINRGAGADNVRNITASPTAGFDPYELIDTRALARQMHHHILNHRELYGLPRKFNIAFDGGGTIAALEDTNDIGFVAVRVSSKNVGVEPGVYFRMQLGGITGHKDFARDCGILLRPDECVAVAHAVLRVFIEHGDRTDRRKARLKYILDAWGLEKYLAETQKYLPTPFRKVALDQCEPRKDTVDRLAHISFHPQRQPGQVYVGVVLPVGRITAAQMRALASIAQQYGSGDLRLTVWQNILIPDLREQDVEKVRLEIEKCGLSTSASNIRAGLVACTGNAGCKYAAANTKAHALQIASRLDGRVAIDRPVNIHLTGCHHSCAQHYIGDIGMLATKVGEEGVEGYHVYLGGGYGQYQEIAREVYREVPAEQVPMLVERMMRAYLDRRQSAAETFQQFVKRHSTEALKEIFEQITVDV